MAEEQNKNKEKREFVRGNNFDVFVSYRRSDGKLFARTLTLAFKNEGFRCFLDYDKLEGGEFSRQLTDAIEDAPIFVMVLTPDYFSRCIKKDESRKDEEVWIPNEEDWVRREIELALSKGKIIIPIDINGMVNGTPDYLDDDFRNRVGAHQFSPVYDNNAFEATFGAMLDKNIWNIFSKLQKPTDKAVVTVATDADCKLMKNNELLATLQPERDSYILLGEGNHLLRARSEEFSDISVKIIKSIPKVPWNDFIEIELANKLQPLIEEKRRKEEEEKIKQKETGGKNFDIFISYRRSDGYGIARWLDQVFSINYYRTFLDSYNLAGVDFAKSVENAIIDAPVFVMVLTPDYFARCNQESDFVRREIELALANDKIIIPINVDGALNNIPDYLDEDFRNRIGAYSWTTLFTGPTIDACFNDFLEKRIKPFLSK